MVKTSLVILIFLIGGCSHLGKISQYNGDCRISLKLETTKVFLDKPFAFSIENKNEIDIELSEPGCLANTIVTLYDSSGKLISTKNKIKVNPDCKKIFVRLLSKNSIEVTFPYTIETLFMIEENRSYKIRIKYNGIVKMNNKKYMCSDIFFEGLITNTTSNLK